MEKQQTDNTWTCSCGAGGNVGAFCKNCGKPHHYQGSGFAVLENSPSAARKKRKKWGAALLAVAVIGAGAFWAGTYKGAANKTVQEQRAVIEQPVKTAKTSKKEESVAVTKPSTEKKQKTSNSKMKTDLSLGDVELGMGVDDMHRVLGQEISKKSRDGMTFYEYPAVEVGTHGKIITALVSNTAHVSTKRGIHEGSRLSEVKELYGNDYMKSTYDDLELYEYNYNDLNGRQGILRFAIKKGTNKVSYISARIPS